jgi:hypothetical protein
MVIFHSYVSLPEGTGHLFFGTNSTEFYGSSHVQLHRCPGHGYPRRPAGNESWDSIRPNFHLAMDQKLPKIGKMPGYGDQFRGSMAGKSV